LQVLRIILTALGGDAGHRQQRFRQIHLQLSAANRLRIDPIDRKAIASLRPNDRNGLEISFCFLEGAEIGSFGFTWHDRSGNIAVHLNSEFFGGEAVCGTAGQVMTARFLFDVPPLADGDYSISFGCSTRSGELIEKYDYDSTIQILHPRSPATDRQGGYVIISGAKFELDCNV